MARVVWAVTIALVFCAALFGSANGSSCDGSGDCSDQKPLLSLIMMVKNEACSLPAIYDSVKDIIDRYTIFDTGSTDGTVELIRQLFKDIPGDLVENAKFTDYGDTRNKVLDHAGTITNRSA